ncbi:MAG: hypothetical protein HRF49_11775 [bacterium]|jgi:hypothetical protein
MCTIKALYYWLSFAIFTFALLCSPVKGEEASPSMGKSFALLVTLESGEIVMEGEETFGESWSYLLCMNPKGDEVTLVEPSWQMLLKPAGNSWACPFPIVPRGDFLTANFDDGSKIAIRLPYGLADRIATATARYEGKDYALAGITQYEVAKFQLDGKQIERTFDENAVPMIDTWIAQADCKSVVAFHESRGQREALEQSAWVLSRILENYKNQRGSYPHTPCQMYTGDNATISNLPLNPFEIDRNLCESILSQPRPKGFVQYFPEIVTNPDGSEKVVGYWIAVICDGDTKHPVKPLPEGKEEPIRAVLWFEKH